MISSLHYSLWSFLFISFYASFCYASFDVRTHFTEKELQTLDLRVTHNNGITYGVCVFFNPQKILLKYRKREKSKARVVMSDPPNLSDSYAALEQCQMDAFAVKMKKKRIMFHRKFQTKKVEFEENVKRPNSKIGSKFRSPILGFIKWYSG
ncbi:UNVERIFIED_CONTAM: hypothetical protein RMT77_017462 [Armadillidium vulgare]